MYAGLRRFRECTFTSRGVAFPCVSPVDVATLVTIFLREDYGRVREGARVLDVGANVGLFALWSIWCGAARVDAFEPEPENYRCLVRATSRFPVTTHELAIADASGTKTIALIGSTDNTIVVEGDSRWPTAPVQCSTLDEVLRSVGQVDVLKMDIEGGEYHALYPSNLSPAVVKSVRMEYHVKGGTDEDPSGLTDFFLRRGFRLTRQVVISPMSGLLWFDSQAGSSAE